MTAVARRAASGAIAIPPTVALPPVPPALTAHLSAVAVHAEAVARWRAATELERAAMHIGPEPQLPALTEDEAAEVARARDALDRELVPVSLEVLRAWLGPVNAAVRNPQTREDFEVRCFGLHALLDDLPNGAFTGDARRLLPSFFPAADDIRKAVQPDANRLSSLKAAIVAATERRAAPTSGQAKPPPPTADEIAAVKAKLAVHEASMAESQAAMRDHRPATRPNHLGDRALLAHYEAAARAGNRVAAFRAEQLRQRVGPDEEHRDPYEAYPQECEA